MLHAIVVFRREGNDLSVLRPHPECDLSHLDAYAQLGCAVLPGSDDLHFKDSVFRSYFKVFSQYSVTMTKALADAAEGAAYVGHLPDGREVAVRSAFLDTDIPCQWAGGPGTEGSAGRVHLPRLRTVDGWDR